MDLEYDEQRGNPKDPRCLTSCATAEELYQSTQDVWEWQMPADGDNTYRTIHAYASKPC